MRLYKWDVTNVAVPRLRPVPVAAVAEQVNNNKIAMLHVSHLTTARRTARAAIHQAPRVHGR